MQKFKYLILWLAPIILSCEKQDNNLNEDKEILLDLYENPYFPLDTNDLWIYTNISCLYDDVLDSIDESYCTTKLDTIIPSQRILTGRIVARKFNQNYFNTQHNKVSLIIDPNLVFKKQYIVDLLFTELNDTTWSDTVQHAYYGEVIIGFIQSKTPNYTADEITLTIHQGYFIGLHDRYVFQKNRGIVSSSFTGINMDGITELKEYKDN